MKNLLILLLIFMASCSPKVITKTQTVQKDSTIIREVPRIINLPAANIRSPSINLDSLFSKIKAGIKPEILNRTLYKEDPESGLKVGLVIDELGSLSAICEQREKQIEILEKQIEHWKQIESITVTNQKNSFWENLYGALNNVILGALLGAMAMILLRR